MCYVLNLIATLLCLGHQIFLSYVKCFHISYHTAFKSANAFTESRKPPGKSEILFNKYSMSCNKLHLVFKNYIHINSPSFTHYFHILPSTSPLFLAFSLGDHEILWIITVIFYTFTKAFFTAIYNAVWPPNTNAKQTLAVIKWRNSGII